MCDYAAAPLPNKFRLGKFRQLPTRSIFNVFSPIRPSMASKNLSFSSCGSNVVHWYPWIRDILADTTENCWEDLEIETDPPKYIPVFKGNPYAKKFWNRTILFGSCVKITYDHLLMRKNIIKNVSLDCESLPCSIGFPYHPQTHDPDAVIPPLLRRLAASRDCFFPKSDRKAAASRIYLTFKRKVSKWKIPGLTFVKQAPLGAGSKNRLIVLVHRNSY